MSKVKAIAPALLFFSTLVACGSDGESTSSTNGAGTTADARAPGGTASGVDQNKLLGRWLIVKDPMDALVVQLNVVEFRSDGSMNVNANAGRWKVAGDRLEIEVPQMAQSWTAVFDGDLLRLRDVRGGQTILRRLTGTLDPSGAANTLEVSAFVTLLRQGRVQSATTVQSGRTVTVFGRYERGRYEVSFVGAEQCQELKRALSAVQDAGIKADGLPDSEITC